MADKTKQIPTLSKSRFMAGIQCEKRLYLECHHMDLTPQQAGCPIIQP